MEFKVGQKWKNRSGEILYISNIFDGLPYPIMMHDKDIFRYAVGSNGTYFMNGQHGSEYDLIELIEENEVTKEEYEEIREEEKVQSEPEEKTFGFDSSVAETLEQRGGVYGKFSSQLECVTSIVEAMEKCSSENGASWYEVTYLRTEWYYLAIKLARIASNSDHTDSYHDLAGYAMLLEKEHENTN